MNDTSPQPIGYLDLVSRNPNFRSLWLGQIVSLFGDWFNLIASAALIAQLTESGLAVGGLFVIRMLAPFLVSPIAGVAADRYNRRTLLVLTDLSRAVVVLGFLLVRDPADVWLLYLLTALQLGISGVFFPTRNAILPDVVRSTELGTANALSSTTWSVMLALGAALGGLATGELGIYPAFLIDAVSFLISAVFILQIAYRQPESASSEAGFSAALREYLDGLRYMKKQPDVLAIALHKGALGLTIAGGVINVVLVKLAEEVYVIGQGGGTSMGLLYAVAGLGTGVGPILTRRFTGDRERPLRTVMALAYLLSAGGLALAAPLWSFGAVLVGMFLRAYGTGVIWVFSTQLLLQLVPDRVRGRVFSTEFAMFTLASAASAAAGGLALDTTGLGLTGIMLLMAGLAVLPGIAWAAWMVFGRWGEPEAVIVPVAEALHPATAEPLVAPAESSTMDDAQWEG